LEIRSFLIIRKLKPAGGESQLAEDLLFRDLLWWQLVVF